MKESVLPVTPTTVMIGVPISRTHQVQDIEDRVDLSLMSEM